MPGSFLFLFCWIIFYYDAKKLKDFSEMHYQHCIKEHPLVWLLFSFICYFAAAPLFLFRKQKYLKLIMELNSFHYTYFQFFIFTEVATVIILSAGITSLISALMNSSFGLILFHDALFKETLIPLIWLLLMLVFAFYYIHIKHSLSFCEQIDLKIKTFSFSGYILLPLFLSIALALLCTLLLDKDYYPFSTKFISAGSPFSKNFYHTAAVLIFPLLEGIVFLGYFFSILEKTKGKIPAIFTLSLFFVLIHLEQSRGDFYSLLLIFLSSAYLSVLRGFTGSLIPAIVGHYAYHFSILLIPSLFVYFSNPVYFQFLKSENKLSFAQKQTLLVESIQKFPHYAEAYNDLASLYAANNINLNIALTLIETALKTKPQGVDYLDTKAEILFKLKRCDEAIAIEEKLAEKDPYYSYHQEQIKKFKKKPEKKSKPGKRSNLIHTPDSEGVP